MLRPRWYEFTIPLRPVAKSLGFVLQNWVVRSVGDVEQNMVSVERVLHYVELEPEAPYEIPETEPENWPSAGEIKFV